MKKYCSKCILPEDYPGIHFNEDGVCNFCTNYKTKCNYLGEEKLIKLVNSIKRTGKYDCIVPMSGGKDSTYILYYVVKKLKLRAIAINYDSGFQTEIARNNVREACKILNVPLVVKNSKITKKLLRLNFLIGKASGEDKAGGDNKGCLRDCGNCEMLLRAATLRVAKKYKVPIALWGTHSIEDEVSSKLMDIFNKRWGKGWGKKKRGLFEEMFIKLKGIVFVPRGKQNKYIRIFNWNIPVKHMLLPIRYQFWNIIQRISMGVPLKYVFASRGQIPFTEKNPKFVMFYDYVDFFSYIGGGITIEENMKVLKEELGWKHPENKESRFDCDIHWLGNYFHLQKKHISMDGAKFCNQIREGQFTRDEAWKREKVIQDALKSECKKIMARVGLEDMELAEVDKEIFLNNNECLTNCSICSSKR